MNKDQLRKCVGHWVRLIPIAHRLDVRGYPLVQIDDDWRVESVTDAGVRLFLQRTGHGRTLGLDTVHHYSTDRIEQGVPRGFLTLNVQLSIQGNDVHITPTRPGEPVAPRIPPNPVRLALLHRLHQSPGQVLHADHFSEFQQQNVTSEIARCAAEGLLEARLLRDDVRGLLAAAAIRLKPRGADWLRQHGAF
jgi:hypothetical protein